MSFVDRISRFTAIAVCAVLVGAVTGCGAAGSAHTAKPRYGVVASAPATPLDPVRAVPESSRLGHEFIGRYVAMWNYAASTGKTKEFSDLIAVECETCTADVEAMAELTSQERSDYPLMRLIDAGFHSDGRDRWTKRFQAHLQWGDGQPVLVDMDLVVQRESLATDADDAKFRERGWRMQRIQRLPDGYYATAYGAKTPPSLTTDASGKKTSRRSPTGTTKDYPGQWLRTPTNVAK